MDVSGRQLVAFVQTLPSPEALGIHQLLLYGRGLLLQQKSEALESLLASLPSLFLTQLARMAQFDTQSPEQRQELSRVAQELYDLRSLTALLSSPLSKFDQLNRMASLRQNLPARWEPCCDWRLLMHWRELAFAKFDELSFQKAVQEVRGDVEWYGLQLLEKFASASDVVGMVQLADELLQRKWLSVPTLTRLVAAMVDVAIGAGFEVDAELCTHANLSIMQGKDKAVMLNSIAALLSAKLPPDAGRAKALAALSQAVALNPDDGDLWHDWSNLLSGAEPMKDVVATMVASLEKQAHVDARLILKLLNRVISNKVSLSDLSVLLDQFPSRLFLPFLSLLFPADSHLFQLLAPVRRVVRRDHGAIYTYYLKWRSETCLQRVQQEKAISDVGVM